MDTPFYLTASEPQSAVDIPKALQWSYDYDYQNIPEPQNTDSFWESIAEPVVATKDAVWSTAKGTWESVKSAGTSVISTIDEASDSVVDKIFGGIDSILIRGGIIFALLIAGIWIVARTGIIADIGKVMTGR